MSLLKKAVNQQAFGKVGLFGFQGSGKTHTAMLIAHGICKHTGGNKIAFFDTETGSDWWVSRMPAGVDFLVVKSRAFTDLCATIKECEAEKVPVLVVDSITHVWRDLCESYLEKINRKLREKKWSPKTRLEFPDWQTIKKEWGTYTDLYVNSTVHIMVCGRAGYEYDFDVNEDGTKDLIKTGTKMKAEGEFGFEPSLVIEMERVSQGQRDIAELKQAEGAGDPKEARAAREQKKGYRPKIGSLWIHRAHVLKDRADKINGQSFDNPSFESFSPHFAALNIGGEHVGVDTSRDSTALFDGDGNSEWKKEQRQKATFLDEVKELLLKHFPGTAADMKKARGDIGEAVFSIRSFEAVGNLDANTIARGLTDIRWLLEEADKDKLRTALNAGASADGKRIEDGDAARAAIRQMLDEHADDLREEDALDFPAPEEKTANA